MAKTPNRNFRCDDERWDPFLAECKEAGTDASRQLRDLIDEWMEGRRVMRHAPE